MELEFGSFLTPSAGTPDDVVALAVLSEAVGLDLVTFQDHPYQPAFLDTWTLLAYVAARTQVVRLAPNVLNLPLRPPAVVARSAASLDLLSGGRFELGIGAGAFWAAIDAMGGRRLGPGDAVDALDEAIQVVRAVWATSESGGVRVEGDHYRVVGAKRGPAPAHEIGVWVGAYKPRMLRLTGRAADGWLPSLGNLPGGPDDLSSLGALVDDAAAEAGRDPSAVRRLLNVGGTFAQRSTGLLQGPPDQWAEELAGLALDHRVETFVLASDDPRALQVFAQEVAPLVRELVSAEVREQVAAEPVADAHAVRPGPGADGGALGVVPTPDDGGRRSAVAVWDEAERPTGPEPDPDRGYDEHGRALGRHLVEVHDHLRAELARVVDLVGRVRDGVLAVGDARSELNDMALRQNSWTLGGFCESYCRVVTSHHSLEDEAVFPHLRAADPRLAGVIDRLESEHLVIHHVLDGVDQALVHLVARPDAIDQVQDAVDLLADSLLSHLSYEERELVEPLARLGFYAGQV